MAPVILLVRPQLAENVGMTARAMANCGFAALRLVAPSFSWDDAQTKGRAESAAGRGSKLAHKVLAEAQVFADLDSAVSDLQRVWATSARNRDLPVPQVELFDAVAEIVENKNLKTGILFGPERTGLENDEMVFAEKRIFVPLAEGATSLNLAQAVLLICWEWRRAERAGAQTQTKQDNENPEPAPRELLTGFLTRLEAELIAAEYYPPTETAAVMRRNLRAFFARSQATAQELQSLEGMIRALADRRAVRQASRSNRQD